MINSRFQDFIHFTLTMKDGNAGCIPVLLTGREETHDHVRSLQTSGCRYCGGE
ncbi:protein of unknown function [Paenibacillus alvei]|uniref:Uncharacterized protein n=1 Tax=Paenibacillus alvei TaxID=44250 RepID=A0A383R528_PAEAL|nr:protein of unknown function [Paenibacillus alvei]